MLSALNLYKSYSINHFTIDKVSITLKEGEMNAIVGESGSGKTTLLNLLSGLLEPDKGEIFLNKNKIQPTSEQLIPGHPKIKLVAQDFNLFPNLTIRENILYSIRFYEKKYQNFRVDYLIDNFGLSSIQNHLPKDVSGGEKQRTAIAQSIADEPSVLLLDEPFNQLDVQNKLLLKREINHLVKNEKMACAFVTHDINDALSGSDYISIIRNGKIIQTDTPERIYSNPLNDYVANISGICTIINSNLLEKYFNEKDFLIFKNKKLLIRPENIFLKANSKVKGIVKEVLFLGDRHQVGILISGLPILCAYTNKKIILNEQVSIEFDIENIKILN